jgi:hypothetical protein
MMATGGPEARTSELGEVEIVDGQRAPTAIAFILFFREAMPLYHGSLFFDNGTPVPAYLIEYSMSTKKDTYLVISMSTKKKLI